MFTEDKIREIIYNRLPDSIKNNSGIIDTVLALIEDNNNSEVDKEELTYLFIDKFFMSLEYFDTNEIATSDYAYACKFSSYLLLGYDVGQAYEFTFPKKAEILLNKGSEEYGKRLAHSGKVYANRAMVSKITDIALVPIYVTNAPILQESIDMLVHLMRSNKTNDYLRKDCAVALLKELKQPEILHTKQEIEVKIDTDNLLEQFKRANAEIATTGVKAIESKELNITDVDAIFKNTVGK